VVRLRPRRCFPAALPWPYRNGAHLGTPACASQAIMPLQSWHGSDPPDNEGVDAVRLASEPMTCFTPGTTTAKAPTAGASRGHDGRKTAHACEGDDETVCRTGGPPLTTK
jgi:hypothetical protein